MSRIGLKSLFIFLCIFLTACNIYDVSNIPECDLKKQMPFNCVSLGYTPFQKINLSKAICKYSTEFHDTYVCYEDLNTGWITKNNSVKYVKTDKTDMFCYNIPSSDNIYCDIITLPNGENITQNCYVYPVDNLVCVPKQNVMVRRNVKIG